ncbi:Uncharacterised protein [Mycobacterium tuberculosis]|uniref:Secreted protein n=2 Tax=Mycobacterium tuberculosis TaxID=1773 RepID=A0A916LCW7_MYCTX|nr:Uncharacterised protein [Mycobacterium tuberculosis]
MRQASLMCASLTSWAPITMSRPASAALGISSTRLVNSDANSRIHTPCRIVDIRVRAPAATLAELRTMTPVMGSPPSNPDTTFALPCPTISRLKSVRGP